MSDMNFWKRKLAAYLHDPPSKALDIQSHGERSNAAFHRAGFIDTEIGDYLRSADYTAAAADRLPFPASQPSDLRCTFDGVRNAFIHPLAGDKLRFHAEFKSAEQGMEAEETTQPVLTAESLANLGDPRQQWRARFFAHWRLWPKHAVEKDYRLGFLPADTRIPDHSIWNHMQVVSALDGCVGASGALQPAFLKFQIGPVQDFIAAARSTRDLWSGSQLLSWLMAAGLKTLSAELGPDAVIFPNLRGQPLFDLHWREELWDKVKIGSQTIWESSLKWENSDLLTPNLPNVFLAVVPVERATEIAATVKEAMESEWQRIAAAVWRECDEVRLTQDEPGISASARHHRFQDQISRFLTVSWQFTPWPDTLPEALKLAEGFASDTPIAKATERVQSVVRMATQAMPLDHRDGRYYVGGAAGPKIKLNNIGLGWSIILAFNSWALDAVRQTRSFAAANAGGWQTGVFNNKDVLTGRDEAVAGGTSWAARIGRLGGEWPRLFKHLDWMSASTLVKRLWHRAYLQKEWNFQPSDFKMPNTRGIAAHDPFARDPQSSDENANEDSPTEEKYFAVLALDGDEIGKWFSGEKAQPFSAQLADYQDGTGTVAFGAKCYFDRPEFASFQQSHRPISPSYHLQFSEALSNFALLCARPIVDAFKGRLIYAGGDDVWALLPADQALTCAEALRAAFRGQEVRGPDGEILFQSPAPGFLASARSRDDHGRGRPIPFLVPGPKADCSVGLAIAHFKAPLQDVVRAARAAEKRAKSGLGRGAVAVSLCKRSGETIEWGCQWVGGGLALYRAVTQALATDQLSAKFPHRVIEVLEPYLTEPTDVSKSPGNPEFAAMVGEIIQREFAVAGARQRGPAFPRDAAAAAELLGGLTTCLMDYLDSLHQAPAEIKVQRIIGLCQTVAFANRTRAGDSQP